MDTRFELHGITFVWDKHKARINRNKHGVSFEQATEAFFDPLLKVLDSSTEEEARDAIIGMDTRYNLLFVVHIGTSASFPPVRQRRKSAKTMKIERLKKRLRKDRPMISVTLRVPEDVVEDLKRIAPLRGFSGYQPLMRAYIGQGLRKDLERFESPTLDLIESLKRLGVSEEVIEKALSDAGQE
jgi:Uncharacterized protein conserved in bacteria